MPDDHLLTTRELPAGFVYPAEFLRVVRVGLVDLEPWLIVRGTALKERHEGLKTRFPDRHLVPFARRQDNDDVACWDLDDAARVAVVHDFAPPGWERRPGFADFYGWLRQAVEDLIEFE